MSASCVVTVGALRAAAAVAHRASTRPCTPAGGQVHLRVAPSAVSIVAGHDRAAGYLSRVRVAAAGEADADDVGRCWAGDRVSFRDTVAAAVKGARGPGLVTVCIDGPTLTVDGPAAAVECGGSDAAVLAGPPPTAGRPVAVDGVDLAVRLTWVGLARERDVSPSAVPLHVFANGVVAAADRYRLHATGPCPPGPAVVAVPARTLVDGARAGGRQMTVTRAVDGQVVVSGGTDEVSCWLWTDAGQGRTGLAEAMAVQSGSGGTVSLASAATLRDHAGLPSSPTSDLLTVSAGPDGLTVDSGRGVTVLAGTVDRPGAVWRFDAARLLAAVGGWPDPAQVVLDPDRARMRLDSPTRVAVLMAASRP